MRGHDADLAPIDPAIDAALSLDGDVARIRDYYEGWAGSYDRDVGAEAYALPEQVAALLAATVADHRGDTVADHRGGTVADHHRDTGAGSAPRLAVDPGPPAASVLDVGCGTGLIGERLRAAGYERIDGVDLSAAMIERAADRGCYRELRAGIDITAPLPDDLVGRSDIVICGGVFTVGHVPPSALGAVASLTRPGGLLIVTTRARYYEETGYQAESDRLVAEGRLQVLTVVRGAPYTLDSTGHYWAYAVAVPGPGAGG